MDIAQAETASGLSLVKRYSCDAEKISTIRSILEATCSLMIDHPDSLMIDMISQNNLVTFRIKSDPRDFPVIVGRNGRHARSMRTLLSAMSHGVSNVSLSLEIDESSDI